MENEYKIEAVKDFNGYKIDTNGTIYGLNGNKLNGSIVDNGVIRVAIYKDGNRYNKLVHRLVAKQFLNATDYDIIKHKDGNLLNNSVDNLIVEHSEYGKSMISSDKKGKYIKAIGDDNSLYFQSIKKAGEFFKSIGKSSSAKVAQGNIRRSLKFGYSAYGYQWEFVA